MEETRMKTHTSAMWSTCCICRSKNRFNPGQVLRIYIPVTKSGIEELENMMFSEMEKENTCSLAMQFGGRGGTTPKQKNALIGCPTEKWKKKAILVVEWQGIEIPKKNLQRREKTHSDSLGKQFPFGKIRQDILTRQIWELFTSTQYTTYCIYRVSDTKPGNHHVSSKPQSIHC